MKAMATLPAVGDAGAVVVPKELLDLVPGHLKPGLGVGPAGLVLHLLHAGRLLHLIVALDVDGEGVGDPALEGGGASLDDIGVLGLLEEDGQGEGGGVAGGQGGRQEGGGKVQGRRTCK